MYKNQIFSNSKIAQEFLDRFEEIVADVEA